MSESQDKPNDKPENVAEFFKTNPPPEIDSNIDAKSDKEEKELFCIDPTTFEEYLRHEEFIIRKLNNQSERKLREENANKAFNFSLGWAGFIGIVVIMKSCFSWIFKMTEAEYLATIGTLSITILTYYLVVIRYLFYKRGNDNHNNSE